MAWRDLTREKISTKSPGTLLAVGLAIVVVVLVLYALVWQPG